MLCQHILDQRTLRKKKAAQRIDLVRQYYTSEVYAEAWRNACRKAITEVRVAGTTAVRS